MAIKFPSPEWTTAFQDAVNANAGYREAGKGWVHGKVAYVLKADDRIGTERDMAMLLDLHQGQCRNATYVPAEEAQSADFVIVAEYPRWKEVLSGEVDPTKAMMQNKLRLEKGHLPTIVKFVLASKELVKSATAIDTDFPPVA
jgi:putative sterol carrier protein